MLSIRINETYIQNIIHYRPNYMNETYIYIYIYIQLQNKIKLQKGRNKAQRWKMNYRWNNDTTKNYIKL